MTPTEEINLILRIVKSREDKTLKILCPVLPKIIYIVEDGEVLKCSVTGTGIMLGRYVGVAEHLDLIIKLMTEGITISDIFFSIEYIRGGIGFLSIARYPWTYMSFEEAHKHINI